MKKTVLRILSWAAVLLCMGVIFFLSSQNGEESTQTSNAFLRLLYLNISPEIIRTAAHFLEFTGLAVLLMNALYQSFGYLRPVLSFALSSVYAATDEIHQLFVEGRACTLSDWAVDSLGAVSGIAVICAFALIFSELKRRKKH